MPLTIGLIGIGLHCGMAVGQSVPVELPERILEGGRALRDVQGVLLAGVARWETPEGLSERQASDGWSAEQTRRRLAVFERAVRPLPAAWEAHEVRVQWKETIERDGYTIRKFLYEPVPTLWIGGLLYEPDAYEGPPAMGGKVPAVLNVNGHERQDGMFSDYKQTRCLNQVKRGMIAMNVEWIGMGQLQGEGYVHAGLSYLDLAGVPGLSVFYLSLERALDVLLARPHVDPERVAVTGLSGGGWQTLLISALDERVKLAAPNAGFIGLHQRVLHAEDIGDREQLATDLCRSSDYVHLTSLIAPRPLLLIYNENDDCCFKADRAITSIYEPMRELYEALGMADRLVLHVNTDPGTHNYEKDNREALYRFLNRHFVPSENALDEEIPVAGEIPPRNQLELEYPEDNGNFFTLAQALYEGLPETGAPTSQPSEVPASWSDARRQELRGLLRWRKTRPWDRQRTTLAMETRSLRDQKVTTGALRVHGTWSLPWVAFRHRTIEPELAVIYLDDRGWRKTLEEASGAHERKELAICTDLLLIGECVPEVARPSQWAKMLESIGYRTLGVQVWQLHALIERVRDDHSGLPISIHASGRVSGTVALTLAALEPELVKSLQLADVPASFKDLLADKITYHQAPSLFCLGLLRCADVNDLKLMAHPTKIETLEGG